MAKYIDVDDAIRTALEMCVKVVGHGITQIDAVEIAEAMENISTADVVEETESLRNIISHKDAEIERLQSIIKEIVRD